MIATSIRTACAAAMLSLCLGAPAAATTYPEGFEERTVASGLTQAIAVDWAPDNTAFIAEKPGRVKMLAPGASSPALVLDISDHVNDAFDRGLNGIAVDRNFEANGYVYLTYVYDLSPLTPDSDLPMVSRVTRVEVRDGVLQNPASPETVLLGTYASGPCPAPASDSRDCIPADDESHTMGTVRAGADGTLWVGTGDGSAYNRVDTRALRALDERSLAGKVLHVNANGQGLAGHSFCPANTNLSQNCTKVHAKGFRNPFRFHLRPGETTISVGDVGWNTREELDLIGQGGESYGWPCYEGTIRTPQYEDLQECRAFYAQEGTPQAQRPPAYDYDHTGGGSIIGGPTYTAAQYPAGFRDSLFFGDFSRFELKRLAFDANGDPVVTPFAKDWMGTDLEIGPGGDLYYMSPGDFSNGSASLKRVVYTPGNASPTARATATPEGGPAPLEVRFSGSGSTDPDNDLLAYEWDFGDGTSSTAADPVKTYTSPGAYVARLTVRDGRGLEGTDTVTIAPGETPPTLTVEAPLAGTRSRGGETLSLRASATDAQDATTPRIDWTVLLRHAEHAHPVRSFTGEQGSFAATRDHDADSSHEVTARATDSAGLTTEKTVTVAPATTMARLSSTPGAATVSYGGRSVPAPYSQLTAIGYETTVSATRGFEFAARPFRFVGWSDGGEQVHAVRVPESGVDLTATYFEDKAAFASASASSSNLPDSGPEKAIDGNPATRWSSTPSDGQHWQVDLGRIRRIDRVELDWGADFSSGYRVLTSTDGQTFTQVAADSASAPGERLTTFAAQDARYVRVAADARPAGTGVALNEARVLGPPDPPGLGEGGPVAPPTVAKYSGAVLATPGLAALYGLGDADWRAREARGQIRGRYTGGARRGRALLAGTADGGSRSFDGADDAARLPTSGIGTPRALSAETWMVAARRPNVRRTLFYLARTEGEDGFTLVRDGDGRLRFTVARSRSSRGVVLGPRLRTARVYHVAATYDGRALRLYVNGRLRAKRRYSGGAGWRAGRRLLVAGPARRSQAHKRFAGRLDELALYRRALTAAQVRSHWNSR